VVGKTVIDDTKGRTVVQALLGTSIDSSAKYTILAILPIAFGGDKV
jgi:hypothetical protein